jgi:hypothetical protein
MFVVDMFNRVNVGVLSSPKQVRKFAKHNGLDGLDASGNGWAQVFNIAGALYYIMYVSTPDPRLICHESCHMADFILSDRGVPLSLDNTEVRAYLTDFIFSEVCRLVIEKAD